MTVPFWAVTLSYWLHMLATVVWIGGLAALGLIVLPAAARVLDGTSYTVFLGDLLRRLDWLGWFSLAVLAGTGLVQMSANPNYQGFLTIGNRWAGAILIKHLVIGGMIGVSALMTWGVLPGLRRAALRLQRLGNAAGAGQAGDQVLEARRASQSTTRLLRLNLFLSIIVLALTAAARAA